MELTSVPHHQLLDIYRCVKREMNRRTTSRERKAFRAALRTYEELYQEEFASVARPGCYRGLPPTSLEGEPTTRISYIKPLLKEDWSSFFPDADPVRRFYVYAHCDPSEKQITFPRALGGPLHIPFYIGKGTGARAFDLNRNEGHGVRLRSLAKQGYGKDKIVKVLQRCLTEAQAHELESKLIYFFGTIFEKGRNGVLVNLDIPPKPVFNAHLERPKRIPREAGLALSGGQV